MNSPKLWTKDFIIVSLINFFTHIIFYMLMVSIATYVSTEFNTSHSVAGLATGIFVLASLVARVFAGKYMDYLGRRKVLIGAMIVFVIAMFLHLWAESLILLLGIRTIHGATHGFITTVAGAVVADLIPDERRGEGTGYYVTSMNIAMAIGPFIGIFISGKFSYQMVFTIGTIVALLDLISALLLKVPEVELSDGELKKSGFNYRSFMEPGAVPISIALFAITLAYTSLLAYLSLYAKEIGLSEVGSFFFSVYAIALLVTRPFTGRWFDKFGENFVTYPMIISLAIGFLLLSQATNGVVFLLSAALIGIGYGTIISNFQAIAIQQSPPNRKALATSTFFITLDLANGVGPYLVGLLIGFMSLRLLYLNVTFWVIICIGIYYVVHGKKAARQRALKKQRTL
jgi:MFS family permease